MRRASLAEVRDRLAWLKRRKEDEAREATLTDLQQRLQHRERLFVERIEVVDDQRHAERLEEFTARAMTHMARAPHVALGGVRT